jgi:hypothetical protein
MSRGICRFGKKNLPKAQLTGKMCKKCKTFKKIELFHLCNAARDGHTTYCMDCNCRMERESYHREKNQ